MSRKYFSTSSSSILGISSRSLSSRKMSKEVVSFPLNQLLALGFKAQTNERFLSEKFLEGFPEIPKEIFQKDCQWFTQAPSREAAWFRETEEGPCQSLHVQLQSVPGAVCLQIAIDFFTYLIKRNVPIANCKIMKCNLRSDANICPWKRRQLGKQYLHTFIEK